MDCKLEVLDLWFFSFIVWVFYINKLYMFDFDYFIYS